MYLLRDYRLPAPPAEGASYAGAVLAVGNFDGVHNGHRAVIWFRPWEPAAESPDGEYPFWLCTGRVLEHWHTATMTGQVKELQRAMPAAYAEFHPQDALELGVREGSWVRISSRRGSIKLRASIMGRSVPQRGAVFLPFFDEGKLINEVTLDAYCPMSKEPDYKKCAVRVEVDT